MTTATHAGTVPAALFGLLVWAGAAQARAQGAPPPVTQEAQNLLDDAIEDEMPVRPIQNIQDVRRIRLERQLLVRQHALRAENFDTLIFGVGSDSRAARIRLDSILAARIEELVRDCPITDAQKKKLTLAGRGDIKRFFDEVAEKKRKFDDLRNDSQRFNEVFREIQSLQPVFDAGLFNDGSFFSKTVKNTLDEEQASRLAKNLHDRAMLRYRSSVSMVLAKLGNSVGLSAAQREKFVALVLAETEPPRKFGQYDTQFVLFQAARLPESKVKAIFSDAQWRILSRQLTKAKGMDVFLRSNGLLEDDGPDTARPEVDVTRERDPIEIIR